MDMTATMNRIVVTNAPMRLERLSVSPGGPATWQVVGHPFRVVGVGPAWRVVAVGSHSRRVLIRHDLLGRPFSTRGAALHALGAALAP
jgi:hypothetical protein